MRTAAIIQARMGSTRLPGKILKTVSGKSLLEHQIDRLRQARGLDTLVVATTQNAEDDAVVRLCEKLKVAVFRGSEQDVLSRYHAAAVKHGAEAVVRITADCPLIDPGVVTRVVNEFSARQPDCDYASNVLQRTYPRGMDTEIFTFECLSEAAALATAAADREHVTRFIVLHPEKYHQVNVAYSANASHYRLTVDTAADFELIERIFKALYPVKKTFTLEDVLGLLRDNPEWADLNSHVTQKDSSVAQNRS